MAGFSATTVLVVRFIRLRCGVRYRFPFMSLTSTSSNIACGFVTSTHGHSNILLVIFPAITAYREGGGGGFPYVPCFAIILQEKYAVPDKCGVPASCTSSAGLAIDHTMARPLYRYTFRIGESVWYNTPISGLTARTERYPVHRCYNHGLVAHRYFSAGTSSIVSRV